ncbi:hypothetical protein Tco_0052310 [Tanacetum coccineum]
MGVTLILATLDGLDVGLLEDVIDKDDCDDDDCDEEMSLVVEELYEESIEEDDVSLVDGVLEGAFGALGDDSRGIKYCCHMFYTAVSSKFVLPSRFKAANGILILLKAYGIYVCTSAIHVNRLYMGLNGCYSCKKSTAKICDRIVTLKGVTNIMGGRSNWISDSFCDRSVTIPNRSFNNNPYNFNNLEGLVSNFMASQDARLSKFEADFKQQQSEMTNKIDIVLKAITNRMAGALLRDTIKNPKLNTSPVSPIRSYPTINPQCSSHPSTSINVIKSCSKEESHS